MVIDAMLFTMGDREMNKTNNPVKNNFYLEAHKYE